MTRVKTVGSRCAGYLDAHPVSGGVNSLNNEEKSVLKFLFISCILEQLSIRSDVKDRMDKEVMEDMEINLEDIFQNVEKIENLEAVKELVKKIQNYETALEEEIKDMEINLEDIFQNVEKIENLEEVKNLIEKIQNYEKALPKSMIQELWAKWFFERINNITDIGQLHNDSTISNNDINRNNHSELDKSSNNSIIKDEKAKEEMKYNLKKIFREVGQFENFEKMKELMDQIKKYEKTLPKSIIQQLWVKWFFEQLIWWYVPGVKEELGDVLWGYFRSPPGV